MRVLLVALLLMLAAPSAAQAILPPYMEDQGSAGMTCRWNPFAELVCGAGSCAWRGEFQWYTPVGDPTGVACAS